MLFRNNRVATLVQTYRAIKVTDLVWFLLIRSLSGLMIAARNRTVIPAAYLHLAHLVAAASL